MDDEETTLDEVVKEVKAKNAKTSKVTKEKPSSGAKSGKKPKLSRVDEVMKQGKSEVKTPIFLNETINKVVKNGNLKPLTKWYDDFDANVKR